jgi:hypothetical protein
LEYLPETLENYLKLPPAYRNLHVVKDGERHVAVMPFAGFHGGTLYLLTWDPALAPTA